MLLSLQDLMHRFMFTGCVSFQFTEKVHALVHAGNMGVTSQLFLH